MGQEFWLDRQVGVFPLSDRFAEMGGIPVNDDGGEQVEPGHAVVLALARAVADFALASDPERVLERVMSLALVQAGVGPALHIGVEQPVDDEERSFDPSDFAESDGQFVLARIGRELSQQLARRKGAAGQGGSNPQDVRPVPYDHVLPDFVAGQSDQGFRNASGLEDMQPFRWQVPDACAIADRLRELDVKLALGRGLYDPGDPMGKLFFNILATFAEFEADLIRMRTREGMAIARAKRKLRGKQPKLSDRQQRELCRMHATGEYSISDLAELFSVSRPTVYRTLNRRLSP